LQASPQTLKNPINMETDMNQIIIHSSPLSLIDMANLKEFNREHKPVIVTVVDNNGYSQRFKLHKTEIINHILVDIPEKYYIVM
jgi:hypothetical protein